MGRGRNSEALVRQDQVPAVLSRAPRGPGAGHGADGPLRQPGFLEGETLKRAFVERAGALGFDAIRIARPDSIPLAPERLNAWLEAGHHGSMEWMRDTAGRRSDPRALWPEVRSVILLGLNYGPSENPMTELAQKDRGYISVYARNRDYHDVIKGKLKEAAGFLVSKASSDVKVFVDTAPVMEKPLAEAAGLGWQGKHTVVVSRSFGNWLFLGAIFTTVELPADEPERDHCGSCRRCLDVCPTNAFPAPYQLDARR
jgi:epoxyqueuosine reductase